MPDDIDTSITDAEIHDFPSLKDRQTNHHTILQVWHEVLAPAEAEARKKIPPQWANRIVTSYHGITFDQMNVFKRVYFGKIKELADILDTEIATDDECLNASTPEEDVEINGRHYLNVLIDWQKRFLLWELEWDTAHPEAAIQLAAISEVHKMFFEQTGLVGLLDQIKFEITDEGREMLTCALDDMRSLWEE